MLVGNLSCGGPGERGGLPSDRARTLQVTHIVPSMVDSPHYEGSWYHRGVRLSHAHLTTGSLDTNAN